ncbi:MAG: hypothetical protein ABIV94_06455 [Acidimicrobiales bacterium]
MKQLARLMLVIAAALGVAAGCSSDANTSAAGSASSPAPEDQRASDTEVAKGLRQIDTIARDLAATTDKAKAQQLDSGIEPVWKTIEGTVKANDADAYIAFEDAFALLGTAAADGDQAAAGGASASVTQTVATYLAAHPG